MPYTCGMHAQRLHLPREPPSVHSQWDWAPHGTACWPAAAGSRTGTHSSFHTCPSSHTVVSGPTGGREVGGVPWVPWVAEEAPPKVAGMGSPTAFCCSNCELQIYRAAELVHVCVYWSVGLRPGGLRQQHASASASSVAPAATSGGTDAAHRTAPSACSISTQYASAIAPHAPRALVHLLHPGFTFAGAETGLSDGDHLPFDLSPCFAAIDPLR